MATLGTPLRAEILTTVPSTPIQILIIDDEIEVSEVMARYLKRRGHSVITAAEGQSGIDVCRSKQPALVLCDLRMPGMDGLEVLAVLTREFAETPVIVVSGMGALADAIQALKLGAWDYVTKPIEDFAVLDHAVNKALERARLLAENRTYREHLEVANAHLERNLHKLQEDEAAGRDIQFRLLPEERAVFGGKNGYPAFECSRHLQTSAILSGDFVDYFDIDGNHFGFYIADVSGHGVSSAFITVQLKSAIGRYVERRRQQSDRTIFDPAAVLRGVNRDLLAGRHGKYLTMFYGVISLTTGQLAYANGGQFPFPILFDGKETRSIGGRSPPVGLFEDAAYRTERLDVLPNFALCLFSDGILEALPESGLVAKQERLQALAHELGFDATALPRTLKRDAASSPADDISVLTVRRIPHP